MYELDPDLAPAMADLTAKAEGASPPSERLGDSGRPGWACRAVPNVWGLPRSGHRRGRVD